jgi:hypothetical protein
MMNVIMRLSGGDAFLARYARPPVRNWRGTVVGEIRPSAGLTA